MVRKGRAGVSAHVTPAVHLRRDDGDPLSGRSGILVPVNGRLVLAGVVWAAVSVVAFVAIGNVIVATGLVVFGLVLLVVLAMASDWDSHPDYEEREMLRARKRKEQWDRSAGSRARDRQRWEAHQARQAEKAARQGRQG